MVVRFITRRYIGEYDPTLEKIYTYHTVIDNETVYFDILDTAGQPHVSVDVLKCAIWTHGKLITSASKFCSSTKKVVFLLTGTCIVDA